MLTEATRVFNKILTNSVQKLLSNNQLNIINESSERTPLVGSQSISTPEIKRRR
jgi:hypothetical protein